MRPAATAALEQHHGVRVTAWLSRSCSIFQVATMPVQRHPEASLRFEGRLGEQGHRIMAPAIRATTPKAQRNWMARPGRASSARATSDDVGTDDGAEAAETMVPAGSSISAGVDRARQASVEAVRRSAGSLCASS